MLQPDLKTFFWKTSVPSFSSQPTFFWSDSCPIRVYEPFPTAKQTDGKGEIRKILIGKNVGKARTSSLFSLKQRLWRNFSFSPHIRNLPTGKGFHGWGGLPKNGSAGETRKRTGRNGERNDWNGIRCRERNPYQYKYIRNGQTAYPQRLIRKPNRNRIKVVSKNPVAGHERNCYLCSPTKNEMQWPKQNWHKKYQTRPA